MASMRPGVPSSMCGFCRFVTNVWALVLRVGWISKEVTLSILMFDVVCVCTEGYDCKIIMIKPY